MRKTRAKFILFVLLVVVSLATSVKAQSEQEKSLKKRVDLFYKYFTDGKIEKMFEFFASKEKPENNKSEEDNKNFEKSKKSLEQLSQLHPKVCIKNMKIENNKAVVTVEISFWVEEKQEWLGDTNNNVWVFENNNWFFQSQIEKE